MIDRLAHATTVKLGLSVRLWARALRGESGRAGGPHVIHELAPRPTTRREHWYAARPTMAELVIHLQIDPETGKKNLIIEYESDSDMLPIEHEEEHRRLLDQIVEGGMVKAEDLGKVVIKRDGAVVVQVDPSQAEQADEGESIEHGS